MITIKRNEVEYELNVDILEELNNYEWERVRVKTEEMVACSPFRDDNSPSFSVNLETGLWVDFGSAEYYSKGNLITLLSFLRSETPKEVEDYLLEKYGIDLSDTDKLSLNIDFNIDTKVDPIIDIETYRQYAFRHPYLANRGISEKVQKAFKVGYHKQAKAIALAWHDIKGNIVNIKFRSVNSKRFFYYPEGQELRNHLYGMHFVYRMNCKKVYLVESEIDALYLWTHGIPAIALGGSKISDARKRLIMRSPIETLVVATDNDAVGKEIRDNVIQSFIGYKEIHELDIPNNYKDVNDIPSGVLKNLTSQTTEIDVHLF